jgi:hypothetical protein
MTNRLDKLRKQVRDEVGDESRPVRDRLEEAGNNLPEGPLGKVGSGDAVGAAGYLAVESTRPFIEFVPGIKQPGYQVHAHGTETISEGTRHRLTVSAVSRNVAEFVAEYTAVPSNIDYFTTDTEISDVEVVEERRTYSTWKVTVDVSTRGRFSHEINEEGSGWSEEVMRESDQR